MAMVISTFFESYMVPFFIACEVSIMTVCKLLILLVIFTLFIATITLVERKILALTQRSVGPNYVGYKGRLQFLADALKLFAKHVVMVNKSHKFELFFFSSLYLLMIYLFWGNVVWMPNFLFMEMEHNMLLANIISLCFSGCVMSLGFISKNKFAMYSAHRVFVMICILEILLAFFVMTCLYLAKSLSWLLISAYNFTLLNLFLFLPVMPILLLALLIETGSTPFDLAEAESELMAGYSTEYGGFLFAMFYLGEYFHLVSFSSVYVVCIFGALLCLHL